MPISFQAYAQPQREPTWLQVHSALTILLLGFLSGVALATPDSNLRYAAVGGGVLTATAYALVLIRLRR